MISFIDKSTYIFFLKPFACFKNICLLSLYVKIANDPKIIPNPSYGRVCQNGISSTPTLYNTTEIAYKKLDSIISQNAGRILKILRSNFSKAIINEPKIIIKQPMYCFRLKVSPKNKKLKINTNIGMD